MSSRSFRALSACALFALACAGSANLALAAETATGTVQEVLSFRQSALANAPRPAATAPRKAALTATTGPGAPAEIAANPYRAYPPSCLSDGLPFRTYPQAQTDPAPLQANLGLAGDPAACFSNSTLAECPVSPGNYTETVLVTAWRVACSGGQSAVLLEFDRSASNEGNTALYPTFPAIAITQNGHTVFPVRLANDPNTIFTTTRVNAPLYTSDIYVLENYFDPHQTQIDYNKAFSLNLDNVLTFNFPDYNAAAYGAASLALPIGGYQTTNWYDPNHSGEGMLVQVYDNNDGATRTFTAAWYTFDSFHLPFWLYAQGTINIGARTTGNVDTYYATGGGFAGNFGSSATFTKWGTINVSFPDCNHMNFSYSGATDAQTNGPGGTGSKTGWVRLANVNSLVCD